MKLTRIMLFVLALVLVACQGVENTSTEETNTYAGEYEGAVIQDWQLDEVIDNWRSTELVPAGPIMLTCTEQGSYDIPDNVECSVTTEALPRAKTSSETVTLSRRGHIVAREYDCDVSNGLVCEQARCLERWERDKLGRALEYTHHAPNGDVFEREIWKYNDAGQLLVHRGALESGDVLEVWTYGPEGHVSAYYANGELRTFNDAGEPLAREEFGGETLEEWTYDEAGRVKTYVNLAEEDVFHKEIWSYYGDGTSRKAVRHLDDSGETPDHWIELSDYNTDDDLASRTLYSVEGPYTFTVQQVEAWDYNKAGELLTYTIDSDADGEVDHTEAWAYNDAGETTRYAIDHDGDGAFEYAEAWAFNDAGQAIEHWFESEGEVEWTEFWFYEGKRLRMHFEHHHLSGEESLEVWEYNSDNQVVSHTKTDTDMALVFSETWTFNDDGALTAHILDQNGDGIPEWTRTSETHGDTVRQATELDGHRLENGRWVIFGDGHVDERVVTERALTGELLWTSRTDARGDQAVTVYEDRCPDTMSFDLR